MDGWLNGWMDGFGFRLFDVVADVFGQLAFSQV